eukprot:4166099-Alexandrium_andersonii.AAC.1
MQHAPVRMRPATLEMGDARKGTGGVHERQAAVADTSAQSAGRSEPSEHADACLLRVVWCLG